MRDVALLDGVLEMAVMKDEEKNQEAAALAIEALKNRPSYGLGFDHGMLRRMGRRCSVDAPTLVEWFPEDLQAYQLAFAREGK